MSLFNEVDYERLNKILEPAELILRNYDLVMLKRIENDVRIKMYENVEINRMVYEKKYLPKLDDYHIQIISSKFIMAKLLLAAAADANKEDSPLIDKFSQKEISLVEEFEKYRVFDILSIEDAVDKIARKERGFYELIVEYYEKQYSNLDNILESFDIPLHLQVAFRNRYLKRQKKIEKIINKCIKFNLIGPTGIIKEIEKTILNSDYPKMDFANTKNAENFQVSTISAETGFKNDVDNIIEDTDIKPPVLEAVFNIAIEISKEGREGKSIGTAFLIGDVINVIAKSKQLILNPFKGYKQNERSILNLELRENIKELAQLDGAFVISGTGVIEAAGRYITVDTSSVNIQKGMGTRHSSVAGITLETEALGVVVSQSGGRIKIFKEGKIVKSYP